MILARRNQQWIVEGGLNLPEHAPDQARDKMIDLLLLLFRVRVAREQIQYQLHRC